VGRWVLLKGLVMTTWRESWTWWGMGILLHLIFCCLGSAAFVAADVCKGFGNGLPLMYRLLAGYGPVACPIFGVMVAAGIILGDVYSRKWVQWCFVAVAALLLVVIIRVMLMPYNS